MNNIETALNELITWVESFAEKYVAEELSKTHNKEFCDYRLRSSKHTITKGKKYFKVSSDGSVRFFVDQDGNIYKPASWAAPAKGIRGNLFSDNKGHEAFHYGGCGLVFVNCAR
jgi:sulfatase maturation enzyme AslB (radical SAM superfamily)